MAYSIFTTANKSYYPFLDIFTSSAIKNCTNLERLYVADSGLDVFRNAISRKQKVSILDTNGVDEYRGVHSEGWVRATQLKTVILNKILHCIDFEHSLIMIDSDVCVLKDLNDLIDLNYDIQVTTMKSGGHTRADGIFISEIASFVIFNNLQKSKLFAQRWIEKMGHFRNNGVAIPHETPAMNLTLKESPDIKFGFLNESSVCSDSELTDNSYSVHFKSNGSTSSDPILNFESRVMSVQNYSSKDFELDQYLNENLYGQWRNTYAIN